MAYYVGIHSNFEFCSVFGSFRFQQSCLHYPCRIVFWFFLFGLTSFYLSETTTETCRIYPSIHQSASSIGVPPSWDQLGRFRFIVILSFGFMNRLQISQEKRFILKPETSKKPDRRRNVHNAGTPINQGYLYLVTATKRFGLS